jgi:hypothetical protein
MDDRKGLEKFRSVFFFRGDNSWKGPISQSLLEIPCGKGVGGVFPSMPEEGQRGDGMGCFHDWRMLCQCQWIKAMDKAAAREQVGTCPPQFPGRTSAQDKPPPLFILIIKVLHRVEDRGYRLDLVHEYDMSLS